MAEIGRRFSLDESKIDPTLKNRIFSPDGDTVVGKWDGESIHVLNEELDRIEDKEDANYNSLPHHNNIPEDLRDEIEKDYFIWACDKQGECLVGEDADIRIESADQIRKHYVDTYGSIDAFKEKLRIERQEFMDSLDGAK